MAITVPVNGSMVPVKSDRVSGRDLKEAAGVDLNRVLIVWRSDRFKLIHNEDNIVLMPNDHFEDVAAFQYG